MIGACIAMQFSFASALAGFGERFKLKELDPLSHRFILLCPVSLHSSEYYSLHTRESKTVRSVQEAWGKGSGPTMQQRRMHKVGSRRRRSVHEAWGMGQGSNNAARKDALIKFIEEDCATCMELRSPDEK
jgi:hypothetical protein